MRRNTFGVIIMLLVAMALSARAQEVGTIAALDGAAQIGRGDTMIVGTTGTGIFEGDVLQTGNPGRMRVVFQDDSVLTLSNDSQIVVNEHVFNPVCRRVCWGLGRRVCRCARHGQGRSLMQLLRGKVTATVSDYYHRIGTRYEIKTVNAVAGVRGTEFSIRFDPDKQLTEVLGISGVVSVHSTVDPTGQGVLVTASEVTVIESGQLPSTPRKVDESVFRQELLGRDFIGASRSEIPANNHPEAILPATGMADAESPPAPRSIGRPDASNLLGQSPAAIEATTGQLDIDIGNP
jgi:hypothetical protein